MDRRRVVLLAVPLALVTLVVVTRPGTDGGSTGISAAGGAVEVTPPTTTSTTSTTTPTTTTTEPATTTTSAKVRAPKATTTTTMAAKSAVVASGEGWLVRRTSSGSEECLEVVTTKTERICGITKPAHVAGSIGVLPVPDSSLFVAVTVTDVTSADLYGTGGGGMAWGAGERHPDPFLPGVQVLTYQARYGNVPEAWAIFRHGDDPVAMARFSTGRLGPSTTLVDAAPTFGRRTGYRKAATGLSWGIHEFGVYDGDDGSPCLVFRRLVPTVKDEAPATTGDACVPATGRKTIEAARVLPTSNPEYVDVFAAFTPEIDGWRYTVPGWSPPGRAGEGIVMADPRDPTLVLSGYYGSVVVPKTAETLTLIATKQGTEVARIDLPIPKPT